MAIQGLGLLAGLGGFLAGKTQGEQIRSNIEATKANTAFIKAQTEAEEKREQRNLNLIDRLLPGMFDEVSMVEKVQSGAAPTPAPSFEAFESISQPGTTFQPLGPGEVRAGRSVEQQAILDKFKGKQLSPLAVQSVMQQAQEARPQRRPPLLDSLVSGQVPDVSRETSAPSLTLGQTAQPMANQALIQRLQTLKETDPIGYQATAEILSEQIPGFDAESILANIEAQEQKQVIATQVANTLGMSPENLTPQNLAIGYDIANKLIGKGEVARGKLLISGLNALSGQDQDPDEAADFVLAVKKGSEQEFIDRTGDLGPIGAKYQETINPLTGQRIGDARMIQGPETIEVTETASDGTSQTVLKNKATGEVMYITKKTGPTAKAAESGAKIASAKVSIEKMPSAISYYQKKPTESDAEYKARILAVNDPDKAALLSAVNSTAVGRFFTPESLEQMIKGIDIDAARQTNTTIDEALDNKTRAMTGANMPENELAFYRSVFVPNFWDSEEIAIGKMNNLNDFLTSFLDEVEPGSQSFEEFKSATIDKYNIDPGLAELSNSDIDFLWENNKQSEGIVIEADNGTFWTIENGQPVQVTEDRIAIIQ